MLLHPSLPPYWLHPMNMWARHCLQSPGPPPDSTFSVFSVTEKFPWSVLNISISSPPTCSSGLCIWLPHLHTTEAILEKLTHYLPLLDCMCNFHLSSRLTFLHFNTVGHSKHSLSFISETRYSIYSPSCLAIPSFFNLGPSCFPFPSPWLISSSIVIGSYLLNLHLSFWSVFCAPDFYIQWSSTDCTGMSHRHFVVNTHKTHPPPSLHPFLVLLHFSFSE